LASSNFWPMCCLSLLTYASDCPFGIFKPLAIALSVLLRFTSSDYPFGIVKLDHCVVCHS
jgi:hypothetical protein